MLFLLTTAALKHFDDSASGRVRLHINGSWGPWVLLAAMPTWWIKHDFSEAKLKELKVVVLMKTFLCVLATLRILLIGKIEMEIQNEEKHKQPSQEDATDLVFLDLDSC